MMYNELVESCFFAPCHVGTLDLSQHWSVYHRSGAPGRGDVCDFYLQCNEEGIVLKACFKAYGNPYLVAAAEWVCCQLEGSQVNIHPQFTYAELIEKLAIPQIRYSAAIQVEDGYQGLIQKMKLKLKGEN